MSDFPRYTAICSACIVATTMISPRANAQHPTRPALSSADIDDIARLEMIEDRRQVDTLDTAGLAQLLASHHPEVRRRAAMTVGRLADVRGIALLRARPLDADTAVAASTIWAIGQIHDPATIPWLDSLLSNAATAQTVATEAAIALGKMKSSDARPVLARFLATAVATGRTRTAISEALLSIGRVTPRGDLAAIVRWTTSPDSAIRWSATWALSRLRDPAAISTLLALAHDRLPLIRSWAVRALTYPVADSASQAIPAERTVVLATRDADRTVRTEAIRALGAYTDTAATSLLVATLDSPDSWLSVSAAEGLGSMRAISAIAPLLAATSVGHPCALRATARQSLQTFAADTTRPALQAAAHDAAVIALINLAHDSVPYCHATALQAMRRTPDLAAATPLRSAIDSILAAAPPAPPASPRTRPAPAPLTRTLADYRQVVERWVVPDYEGQPHPTARWQTPRGPIDLELYPGDAPLAVDDFVRRTEAGAINGTQFTRVVPDFVDQQETTRDGSRLRDEVNRHGLTRGNLAWATAGLDTGNPGYTIGHTPQPHNEGSFTSLGRVIRGMAAADRIELGDQVTTAIMVAGGAGRSSRP